MIGNIVKGAGFAGACAYAEEKPGAQLIDSNMSATAPSDRAREFRAVAEQNPRCSKPVFHASLSAAEGERLSDEQWRTVTRDYMQRMGFTDNQFTVVRHFDAGHDHVHIIANRVRQTSFSVVSDKHDRQRSMQALREIEKQHGLKVVARGEQEEKGYAADLRRRVNEAVRDSRGNQALFLKSCEQRGLTVALNKSETTGHISGVSFSAGGKVIPGRQLGKSYSWPGIEKRLAEQAQKAAAQRLESRAAAPAKSVKKIVKSHLRDVLEL